jgi:hypothetical protein
MASAPIPSVVAMLICDQIITEQVTNKKSLIGVFDKFFSPNFPAMLPRLAVYVKLADALGGYLFRLRIVKRKDESAIAEIRLDTQIPDADQYTELALNMPPLLIPEQGRYEFQLYAGENYLHRVTMQAELAQLPPGGLSPWPQQRS